MIWEYLMFKFAGFILLAAGLLFTTQSSQPAVGPALALG
jgi:hypothetical protein